MSGCMGLLTRAIDHSIRAGFGQAARKAVSCLHKETGNEIQIASGIADTSLEHLRF